MSAHSGLARCSIDQHVDVVGALLDGASFTWEQEDILVSAPAAYPDAHRARIGTNYNELPVNAPHNEVRSYSKDGHMRHHNPGDPTYVPNSKGGPSADTERFGEPAGWNNDGDMVRAAATLHAEDDDWGQAGTLVRDTMDDAARQRLVSNIVGQLLNGVSEPVLLRTFEYLHNVDNALGDRVERGVHAG